MLIVLVKKSRTNEVFEMNKATLDRANEITKQINVSQEKLWALKDKVYRRKRDIGDYKTGRKRWIPDVNWFCRLLIRDKKAYIDAPIECEPALKFELDEECVRLIIKYEEEKIDKLKKELEEL